LLLYSKREMELLMIKKILKVILVVFIVINVLAQVGLMINGATFNILDVYTHPIPKKDTIEIKYKNEYFLNKSSYFEKQIYNECAGYSLAYLLRSNNIAISGQDSYDKMKYKFGNGYVLPRSILEQGNDIDLNIIQYKGNLEQLKTRLNSGNPIIILIGDGIKWQHYVSVVGYDENNVYLFDSLVSNSDDKRYNRVLSNEEFLNLWNNGLGPFSNIYFYLEER